jgi:hypothetical protein
MAVFGAAVAFLGGSAIYSGYKQYQFTHAGDRVQAIGPVPPQTTVSRNAEVEAGLMGWVSDGQRAITAAPPSQHKLNRARQTINRGGDPYRNLKAKSMGRPYTRPNVDLYGPGRTEVGVKDMRNPATDGTMITSLQGSAYEERFKNERPEIMPHPDQVGDIKVPQPVAGFISQHKHGNNGQLNVVAITYDKRARQFHDRSTTKLPVVWSDANVAAANDAPSATNFWDSFPAADHNVTVRRDKAILTSASRMPSFVAKSGNMGIPVPLLPGNVTYAQANSQSMPSREQWSVARQPSGYVFPKASA